MKDFLNLLFLKNNRPKLIFMPESHFGVANFVLHTYENICNIAKEV